MINFCDVYLFRLITPAAFIEIVSGSLASSIFVFFLYGKIMPELLSRYFFLDISTHATSILFVSISSACCIDFLCQFIVMIDFCNRNFLRFIAFTTLVDIIPFCLTGGIFVVYFFSELMFMLIIRYPCT